ncbi:MAG: Vibrio phage pVp [Bacteroidota bacterium]|jgi:DNA repair exonuclease SbcCD nuclease subunit
MRILFTADWHIKLGQKNVPTAWAIKRYLEFFGQVAELEKEVDLHIIGGDLFDRLPTLEELNLYFEFIKGVSVPTYIYDGNHEATKKGKTFFSSLKNVTSAINSNVKIIDKIYSDKTFSILPYCELHGKEWESKIDKNLPLFTHVRGEIPPHVKPEIDLEKLADFPIVFAGDLHSHSNSQQNIVYPGSPMTTSFHRSKVETGALIIEEDFDWSWVRFSLPQLLRVTVSNPKDMVSTEYDHTIYELEGDLSQLSSVKATELLDKKVVKRQRETSLYLNKNMSVEEELVEYLSYILEIPSDNIASIVSVFNDYTKKVNLG